MLVQPTSPNRRLDLKFHIAVSATYSLDDLPWHQSGSLSASQAFLNWTEFVSIGCIYTTIYDPNCEDRVNFSQASLRTVCSKCIREPWIQSRAYLRCAGNSSKEL